MKNTPIVALTHIIFVAVCCDANLYNPYYSFFRYNLPYYNTFPGYANHLPYYNANPYQNFLPPPTALNILAEIPYSIGSKFTVVPLVAMAQENFNMVSKAEIIGVSNQRPLMTVRTKQNEILQCTPAVKIVLDQPLTVYSLKSTIVFPAEIEIIHQRLKIPIKVSTLIAPIRATTFVSAETPVNVHVLYAIPSTPIDISYTKDVAELPDNQAVVIESEPDILPPKNVTIIDFPQEEASPSLQVDEEDEELGNRNPPILLAPAGIVQSTQPHYHTEPFTNPKESPVLIALREEAAKRKRV